MSVQIIMDRDIYLDSPVIPVTLTNAIYAGDADAQRIRFRCFQKHGQIAPMDLSEITITAHFIRPDGGDVVITGTGGSTYSYVDLPEACYVYPGIFKLLVRASTTDPDVVTSVLYVTGRIDKPTTDVIIDPGTTIPSLEDLLAQIDACEAAEEAANAAAASATAAAASGVRTDTDAQGLTDTQKANARTNIGAADAAEVSQLSEEIDYDKKSTGVTDYKYHGLVYLPCSDGATTPNAAGAYYAKYANIVFFNYPNMTYANLREPITGTINRGSTSVPTYDNRPEWFVDEIPDFIVGHKYRFTVELISGTMSNGAQLKTFLLRRKDGSLQDSPTPGSDWVCTAKPEMVAINLGAGDYNNCEWYISIIDLTALQKPFEPEYQEFLGNIVLGVWSGGTLNTSTASRMSTESLQTISLPTRIELLDASYYLYVSIFDSEGSYLYGMGWYNTDVFVPGGCKIAISIHDESSSSMSGVTDKAAFLWSKVRIQTNAYHQALNQIKYGNTFDSMSMFRTIGVLGDSFASGSIYHPGGGHTSAYDLSWGQDLGRLLGSDVTNFSKGGLSTKTWLTDTTYGLSALLSAPKQDLYIINFGINDYTQIQNETLTLGTIADCKEDYTQNPESFYGCYGRIIGNILNYSSESKIVLVTVMRYNERKNGIDDAIKEIAEHFSLPCINVTDDDFFVSAQFLRRMESSHPLAPTYSGIALALKRLIERNIGENDTYWDTYYGVTE